MKSTRSFFLLICLFLILPQSGWMWTPPIESNDLPSIDRVEEIWNSGPNENDIDESNLFMRDRDECQSMPEDIRREIASYESVFLSMSQLILNGSLKGIAYTGLSYIVDTYGPRFTGTENLEKAIDSIVGTLKANGMDEVHTEDVTVPIWKRNNESLHLIRPRLQKMALLGLGSSVGTPEEGITADIVVVRSFQELDKKAQEISGKIVVYNQPYTGYGQSVIYRTRGATAAAKYGALAALVRSVTPTSIYSPHTGWQSYGDNVTKIPAACITVEDAEMFQRMTDRDETITVTLKMGAEVHPDGISRNVVSELTGRSIPEELVIVSGHIDSWDVGQGAIDDGGGFYISAMAPIVVKHLGLRPRRTFRTILWTAEEPGLIGAESYRQAHDRELNNINIVLESDGGTYDPTGLVFSGSMSAGCIVKEILKIVAPLNATAFDTPDEGSDTSVFSQAGVPTGSLTNKNDKYFYYHHSNGDTMTAENIDSLDRCLTLWSFVGYVLADLSVRLPLDDAY